MEFVRLFLRFHFSGKPVVTREMLAIRGLLFLLKMYQRPPSQLLCHLSASILGIGSGKKKAAGGKKQVTKR